jgi:hypothetical protein
VVHISGLTSARNHGGKAELDAHTGLALVQVSLQAALFVGTAQSSFSAFLALDRHRARLPSVILPALPYSEICR